MAAKLARLETSESHSHMTFNEVVLIGSRYTSKNIYLYFDRTSGH